jgi:hypothetical protein
MDEKMTKMIVNLVNTIQDSTIENVIKLINDDNENQLQLYGGVYVRDKDYLIEKIKKLTNNPN